MITNFKEFESYTGANRAIGFRYSKASANEGNHYKIIYSIEKGKRGYIPAYNLAVLGTNTPVKIIPIEDVIKKIKDAFNKVSLEFKEVKHFHINHNKYVIVVDFYCYSDSEADNIASNTSYIIDLSGYKIVNVELIPPDTKKHKIGYKYSGGETQAQPIRKQQTGAYGRRFPVPEFEYN